MVGIRPTPGPDTELSNRLAWDPGESWAAGRDAEICADAGSRWSLHSTFPVSGPRVSALAISNARGYQGPAHRLFVRLAGIGVSEIDRRAASAAGLCSSARCPSTSNRRQRRRAPYHTWRGFWSWGGIQSARTHRTHFGPKEQKKKKKKKKPNNKKIYQEKKHRGKKRKRNPPPPSPSPPPKFSESNVEAGAEPHAVDFAAAESTP